MKRISPKLIGEWVELKFMARAADEGLTVSKPYGDSAPFDFIVGRHQPLHRVQVKGTSTFRHRSFTCLIGTSGQRNVSTGQSLIFSPPT